MKDCKKVTEEDIKTVITSLHDSFQSELMNCTEAELEGYWHYTYDASLPLEISLYRFHDRLKLYQNFCRRWEEYHHGSMCVVERVRDKYLMPKIRWFSKLILDNESKTL